MPRISDLDALVAPNNDDELAIVDKAGVITKKIKRGDLLKGSPLPADTVDKDAIEDDAVTPEKRSGGYKIVHFTFPSSTGNFDITGAGFKPKKVRIEYLQGSNTGQILTGYGECDESGGQFAKWWGISPSAVAGNAYDNRCIATGTNSGGSTVANRSASFVTMLDDGVRINVITSTSTTSMVAIFEA